MLITLFVAGSIAAALTAIFAFRFRTWKAPRRLVAYFASFFVIELVAERLVLPPGILGIEVALVFVAITLLFVVAIHASQRAEVGEDEEF